MVRRGRRPIRRRRNRRTMQVTNEIIITNTEVGSTGVITCKMLSNVPQYSPFKPVTMMVQAVGLEQDPPALQTTFYNSSNTQVASSAVRLLGTTTNRVWLRYPRGGEWFQPVSEIPNVRIATLRLICTGNTPVAPDKPLTIGLIVSFRFQIKPEIPSGSCPKATTLMTNDEYLSLMKYERNKSLLDGMSLDG